MIWATVSSQSCFCWCIELLHLCKEYNQSDFGFDCLVMSMCSLLLCCLKSVFPMTSAFSWQNSISLCAASFCTPRPYLPCYFRCFLTSYFPVPSNGKHIFWVLFLKGLIGLHRTVQLQLLQHYWLGHRLGSLWYWIVCLGNEQRSFFRFCDCIQVLHFKLFCWPWWYSISSKGFLPTVVDIMVIWVKFIHSSPS